jgi:thiol-disulfide isomerase/thioredoxin
MVSKSSPRINHISTANEAGVTDCVPELKRFTKVDEIRDAKDLFMKPFLFTTSLLILFNMTTAADAESAKEKAQALTDQAYAALDDDNYDSAAVLYEKALAAWKDLKSTSGSDSEIEDQIESCTKNFRYSLGEPAYQTLKQGDSLFKQKKYGAAAKLYRQSLENYQKAYRKITYDLFSKNIDYLQRQHGIASCKHAMQTKGPMPLFNLESIRGGRVRLADHKGKPILLVVWVSWCGHCQREIPALQKFYTQHQKDGLVVIGLSTDQVDRGNVAAARKMSSKVGFPMAWITKQMLLEYKIPGYPTMMWIDPKGRFVKLAESWEQEDLEHDLAAILKATPVRGPERPMQPAPPAIQTKSVRLDDIGVSIEFPKSWEIKNDKSKCVATRTEPFAGIGQVVRIRPAVHISGYDVDDASLINAYFKGYSAGVIEKFETEGWNTVSRKESKWNGYPVCDVRSEKDDLVAIQRILASAGQSRIIHFAIVAHREQMEFVEQELRTILESTNVK